MRALLFGLGLLASSPRHDVAGPMRACVRSFQENPENYEHARCLYTLARKDRQAGMKRISALRTTYPQAPYLDVVEGHFLRAVNLERSVELYEKARIRFSQIGNEDGECVAVANLLSVHLRTGDNTKVLETLKALAEIEEKASDSVARARASVMIAGTQNANFRSIGQQYAKLRNYRKTQANNLPYSVQKLLLLYRGHAAFQHGDFEIARKDARHLRKLATSKNDLASLAQADRLASRTAIGWFNRNPDEIDRAEVMALLQRSLKSARAAGVAVLETASLMGLAGTLVGLPDRLHEGLGYADDCLARIGKSAPRLRGGCMIVKSQMYARVDPERSLELAQQAVDLMSDSVSGLDRTAAWRNLMYRAWPGSQLGEAREISEHAMAEIERLRGEQDHSKARRQVFSVWADDYSWLAYRYLQARELDERERIAIAFSLAEKSRARTLLDSTRPHKATLRGTLKPAEPGPSTNAASGGRQGSAPRSVGSVEVATLEQIQNQLLPNEAMLAFQVASRENENGEEFGGVWAYIVTKGKVQAKQLQLGRRELTRLIRLLRGAINTASWKPLLERFQSLLWEPIRSHLPKNLDSLVLVADGPLSLVPWGAVDGTLNYALAASATHWIGTTQYRDQQTRMQGLALIDPFTGDQGEGHAQNNLRASKGPLPRLWHARREASAIEDAFGDDVELLRGMMASKKEFYSRWDVSRNLLHISAHSVFSDRRSEEPMIALSSSDGRPTDWLAGSELGAMKFDGALVVLAGCSTGWGLSVLGDGVLSLARSFQRSGATTVVASLWPVDDEYASLFFERFYQELASGATVESCVAKAKHALKNTGAPASEYDGYVVLGDAQRRFESARPRNDWRWAVFATLLLVGAVWQLRRRKAKNAPVTR